MTKRYLKPFRVGNNLPQDRTTDEESAVIEILDNNGGFLTSRFFTNQLSSIPNPAEGLLIYNLTNHRLEYWDGSAWSPVGDGTGGGDPTPTTPTNDFATVVVSTNYSITEDDFVILVDASSSNVLVRLPVINQSNNGRTQMFIVKRIDSSGNSVTVAGASGSSDTIDGNNTITINSLVSRTLVSDSVDSWYIV